MIIVMHAPPSGGAGKRDTGEDDYSAHWEIEKQRLVEMLTKQDVNPPVKNYPDVTHTEENLEKSSYVIGKLPQQPSTLVTHKLHGSKLQNRKFKITSIYFQEYDGLSSPSPEHPVQHVYGDENKTMKESLGQCIFHISPGAFFQTNTDGAEVLYNVVLGKVREVTDVNPKNALLLDVCCGTGTIGLTCLKEGAVGKVVGVDISEPAIKDAALNAKCNGFTNGDDNDCVTRFVASRAEHVLADELNTVRKNSNDTDKIIIAVVDPAREGLHNDVIKTLRINEAIQRLIYVSCNPAGSLVKDASMLCAPPTKKYPGLPFRPTSAQPVDMFPFTAHCELVMVFDRMANDELHQIIPSEQSAKHDSKQKENDAGQGIEKDDEKCECDKITTKEKDTNDDL